jgi:hypothetical protein
MREINNVFLFQGSFIHLGEVIESNGSLFTLINCENNDEAHHIAGLLLQPGEYYFVQDIWYTIAPDDEDDDYYGYNDQPRITG